MRAYALQKTMNAIDPGVELGAQVYVFWGGREGTETEMVGVNPEVAHEHMAGINFVHGVAQAWEAGMLFHIDLTVRHKRAHMTRAVLEGVAFGLKDSFTLIENAGPGGIGQVRASGGGTKSPLWRQIPASVLEAELVTVNTTEGAAYGAALLAGTGAEVWPDIPKACAAAVKTTSSTDPNTAWSEVYRQVYPLYRSLYPALKPGFDQLPF